MRRTLFLGFLHTLFLTVAECLPSCQQPQTGAKRRPVFHVYKMTVIRFETQRTRNSVPLHRITLLVVHLVHVGHEVQQLAGVAPFRRHKLTPYLARGRTAFAVRFLAVFLCFFIMREAGEIPRLRAGQCAAAPRPVPSRCPLCRCRGTRCGCSGGSCGSISPSARLPQSAG